MKVTQFLFLTNFFFLKGETLSCRSSTGNSLLGTIGSTALLSSAKILFYNHHSDNSALELSSLQFTKCFHSCCFMGLLLQLDEVDNAGIIMTSTQHMKNLRLEEEE